MKSINFYKYIEDLKERQFTFIVGGRNAGKIDFYATYLCCHLGYYLGGFVTYRKYNKHIEIIVKNDDVGSCQFTLFNDTINYENHATIFIRLLQEYDALMRYKYRDYVAEKGQ